MAALRLAAVNCAKPFDAAEAAPAYISFGEFTMDAERPSSRSEARPWRQFGNRNRCAVSAPFEIFGRGRDPDGRAWGRFLRWRDPDGRVHEKFVADEALHGEAAALCATLAADGLEIVREQQRAFANYLSGAQPAGRVTVVQRTGWHEIEGETVFVLPGENIGRKRVGRVLLDGAAHGPYETKGTLAEWREGVATLAAGHAIPMLAISAALRRDRCCTWPASRVAASICSGNPAGARRHACKRPRAFGGAAAHRATFELGAQRQRP